MDTQILDQLSTMGYTVGIGSISGIVSIDKLIEDLQSAKKKVQHTFIITLTEQEKQSYPFTIQEPFTFKLTDYDTRRKLISDTLVTPENKFTDIRLFPGILDNMFKLYDYYFFSNLITNSLNKMGGSTIFEFTDKMTSTGGTCSQIGRCQYKIKISSDRLNTLTVENISNIHVNGITPIDKIEALQLIFEHELVHMLLQMFSLVNEMHGPFFKTITANLFGHTDFRHGITERRLIGNIPSFSQRVTKDQLFVGQTVSYKSKTGEIVTGIITKLNPKRAEMKTSLGGKLVPYGIILPSEDKKLETGVDRSNMYIGKIVKFNDGKTGYVSGPITKLNTKTAKININGLEWTVGYGIIVKE